MKIKNLFCGLACLLLSAGIAMAQGNLQFNQVKYIQMSCTQSGTTVYTDFNQSITVPANKVWKIESMTTSTNGSANSTTFNNSGKLLLDGRIIFDINVQMLTPIWLPAGTYTLTHKSNNLVNGQVDNSSVFIIEFNIVP